MGCGCGGSTWQPPAVAGQPAPAKQGDAAPAGQFWTGPRTRPAADPVATQDMGRFWTGPKQKG